MKLETYDIVFNDGLDTKFKQNNKGDFIFNTKEIQEIAERDEAKPLQFTPSYKSYYSAGDESEIICPNCKCNLDDYDVESKQFRFCPECGQKLMTIDETRNSNI